MDYSSYPVNKKIYSGAERKIGVTVGTEDYIIKFQKKERFGTRNNHISEYLGCRIIKSLGFNVQEVYLGTYKSEHIVAIKDFVEEGQQFVAFNDVGESSIEENRDEFTYSYEDITKILLANNKLKNPQETVDQFWEIFLLDALLGNFDRHGGNWGFIKENNEYTLAPIFDNGSCLFPRLTDEDYMKLIIESQEETQKRIFEFPTSQILLDGKKSSYYDVINSMAYPECNKALKKLYQRYDFDNISNIIDNTSFISALQKKFYKHMIEQRYTQIIKKVYERFECNEKTHS
jgi:hypothetical protein